ncbi:hypothetical protein VI817_004056 [Penicillium citrinum]|nr:hypothetical protein VI817_004056 [Penicillium citrinum]
MINPPQRLPKNTSSLNFTRHPITVSSAELSWSIELLASEREKCFTTISQLPTFVDPKKIPSKKSPFSAILNNPLAHTVEVILPETLYTSIGSSLDAKLTKPQYARVFMSPSSILENDFFNSYVRSGNVIMISEGRSGSDTVFTLIDGICKIEMGKEIYERTGLSGKPVRSGGRKHGKERFLVELNLRLPSMLHGKKGFERIVWAFGNVLGHSLAWLFCDLEPASQGGGTPKPIEKLHPQLLESSQRRTKLENILTPSLQEVVSNDMSHVDMQDRCGALCEWISMAQLRSSRVSAEDTVDPYLSRYSVPDYNGTNAVNLISLKWHGLISSTWTMQLFLNLLLVNHGPQPAWRTEISES